MIRVKLTRSPNPARPAAMQGSQHRWGSGRCTVCAAVMVVAGSLATGGCISVTAPDKPIVIELNINIKQEVIYRLSADAANTIENNPEIF